MNNPFIKYVMKEKKEDIFHSSAYGKAQNGEAIGAASTEGFNDRMKIDRNRQIVKGYNDSRVVNGAYANGPKAKKYVPPEEKGKKEISGATKIASAKSASRPMTSAPVRRPFVPPIKPNFGK